MAYNVRQYWLLSTSFILIIHLKCVPYNNICCLASLLRPPSVFKESELVARMKNWREQGEELELLDSYR